MEQVDTRKENILKYLHVRIVRRILSCLLKHIVARENREWTIDHFLYHHRSKISLTVIGNKNESQLFPGLNKTTNVDNWPLYLFHFLIVDITEAKTLPEEIKTLVRQLKQTRRELYSNSVLGINDKYFTEHVDHIRIAIEGVCEFLQDGHLKEETVREINNVLENMDIPDGTDYIQEFNINHETEKSFRQKVTVFTAEQQRLNDFAEQTVLNLERDEEEASELERSDPTVSIREDDHFHDLEEAERHGHDLTKPYLPPRPETDRYPITLPDVTAEIYMKGCENRQRVLISERVVNALNATDNTDREIQHVFTNTFLSFGEYLARRGCIQIIVRPRTIKHMFQLFNDCINGVLTKKLKPVQDLIRTFPGCETYEQEVVLYKDNYDTAMDNLALQLMKLVVVREQKFKPKRKVVAEMSDQGNVLLHIACRSPEAHAAFKYAVQSGQLQPTIDVLQTEVKRLCPDVSLNARIYENKPDGRGASNTDISASQKSQSFKSEIKSSGTKICYMGDIRLRDFETLRIIGHAIKAPATNDTENHSRKDPRINSSPQSRTESTSHHTGERGITSA